MQDTMLDSTISQLLQDNSQAEYVAPEKSPLATIPNVERSPRNFGETFSCDVDGKHTEITIPADAWDFENETVWLTQAQFAELYRVNVPAINKQIQNIFEDEELQEDSVISILEITASDGKSYRTKHYNLEMLIALGYRIKSKVATKFRQWATKHLKELMTKGHTETQPQLDLSKLTRRQILQMALDAEIAKEEAEKKLALSSQELDDEKADHRHDNCVKNGKCGGITKNRNHYKTKSETLAVENEELKDAVGRGSNWRTVSMMKSEWVREFGHAPVWQKLKQFSTDVGIDPKRDVEEKVVLPDGREKVHLSFRYHREAWARYRKYEENLRVTDKEIENV